MTTSSTNDNFFNFDTEIKRDIINENIPKANRAQIFAIRKRALSKAWHSLRVKAQKDAIPMSKEEFIKTIGL